MADQTIEHPPITLDDLLASEARVEIVDGEMIEMTAGGMTNGIIGSNIITPLRLYLRENPIGAVAQDNVTFLMFSPARRLKDSFVPDVCFIFNENVPPGWNPETPHPGVPDLAVEIVSPNDNPEVVIKKRQTYLAKGTREVWVIYPRAREVQQFTAQGVKIYNNMEDVIDTSGLFPNMPPLTLADIFDLPVWAIKSYENEA